MRPVSDTRAALVGLAALLACGAVTAQAVAGPPVAEMERRCKDLSKLDLGVSRIVDAQVTRGGFTTPDGKRIAPLPDFCRVVIHTSFSTDSSVNSEVWLPLSDWNGRFLGTGNGGMGGAIAYTQGSQGVPDGAMATGLRRGFVVANTDMGTKATQGQAFAPIGHPVKWWDYGWRSTHEMTVVGKQIARTFFEEAPHHSYFAGCSTGGFQSLRAAQSFPEDYDGILAGHPGPDRSAKLIAILYNYMLPKLHPEGRLPNDRLLLMHRAVLKECAGVGGGVSSDPFVSSPQRCHWKPETLLCRAGQTASCLTQPQVDMADRLYAGLRNKRTQQLVWPGLPRGTELGWEEYMKAADEREPPHAAAVRSILGPDHDFWQSDWDRDVETYVQIMSPFWSTTQTDLSAFEQRGGKMLMFFGWNDTSSGYDTINYYEAVQADSKVRAGSTQSQATLQAFFRLFMLPGVEHCRGGNGPNTFDGLAALIKWVEEGVVPERIEASFRPTPGHFPASLGKPMTRPLCPYPAVARYVGRGDTSKAASFVCDSSAAD